MSVSTRHLFSQGPVLAALVRTAGAAMRARPTHAPPMPGPELTQVVPARSDRLIDDYIRHCGGAPSYYRGVVPPHLFPQWGFPLMAKTLEEIPYDLRRVLNGGCRIEVRRPLPRGEALELRACLEDIDDNGKRAVIKQRLITGTASAPEAIVSHLYAIVPLRSGSSEKKKKKKEPKRVPDDLREVASWSLGSRAGWDFALLTGDFNPIHWIRPAARAAGFKNCILHGFSTLGRAIESMNKNVWSGDPRWLRTVDVQFTKPLILPAAPRVFMDAGSFAVGTAPGAPAYLIGTYESENPHE